MIAQEKRKNASPVFLKLLHLILSFFLSLAPFLGCACNTLIITRVLVKSKSLLINVSIVMDRAAGEIVLLTGSSGFLGRHVLRQLLADNRVAEVRTLDKVAPSAEDSLALNDAINQASKKVLSYRQDLLEPESCREAFQGADVVFHCAALVRYDYPPDVDELRRNNVDATANVVKLCVEESVGRLVHCSTTEVTLQPSQKPGIVAVVIYKSEVKLEPIYEERLVFGAYAASKLQAEKIVLKADRTPLKNGNGVLRTVALRPTLLYGEGDVHLLPEILQFAKNRGDSLPRISGSSGKQQLTYAGNAAWAFIRAKETLREEPDVIAGLPVNVTDDTLIENLACFCERVTRRSDNHVRVSTWPVPLSLSYLGAMIFELLTDFGFISKFKIPPRAMVAYLGSVLLYNRARASIHMNYWPKYNVEQTLDLASKYYGELCNKKY